MSHLTEIEHRHHTDGWRDALFVIIAALLIALSVGALTSMGAGTPIRHTWRVTVTEGPIEVMQ